MSSDRSNDKPVLIRVVAAAILLLGIGAALDVKRQPYLGFLTDGDNRVVMVETGGPAEAAGMRVGDQIQSINGVAVNNTRGLMGQPRAELGELRPYIVKRGLETAVVRVKTAPLPRREVAISWLATLIGFIYVGMGLWANDNAPSQASRILAIFCLCFGAAFLRVPYADVPMVRNLLEAGLTAAVLFGFASLLHFLLAYPIARPILGKQDAPKTIYGLPILASLLVLGFTLVQPDATSEVNIFFRTVLNLLLIGYFIGSLATLLRRFGQVSAEDREWYGLGTMLFGALVGLLPLVVASVMQVAAPAVWLPGSQYYFLALALIPITFARVVVRSSQPRPAKTLASH